MSDPASDREVALRLAVQGLADHLPYPPLVPEHEYHLVHRTSEEVIGRRINYKLNTALTRWEESGEEPEWAALLADLETDGSEFIGPSGGWIEFGEEDAPILAATARTMVDATRRHLEAVLRALGTGEDLPEEFYRARDEGLAYSREYMAELRAAQDEGSTDALNALLERLEAERGEAPGDGSPRQRGFLSACLHLLALLAHEVDSHLTADEISPRLRSLLEGAEGCCTKALGVGSFDELMRMLRKE